MTAAPATLVVTQLHAGYDPGAPVVRGASLHVARGEIVALLGPNGAGKSTLLKAMAGLVAISAGEVTLDGLAVTHLAAHAMGAAGIAFVPQTENVFATLSVHENLELGADRLPRPVRRTRIEQAYELFEDLRRQRQLAAGRLSGGQRQMLAIARALMGAPKVLLLDEPSAGLSPRMVGEAFHKLQEVRAAGTAILLVEQNTRAALAIADRAYVLVAGRNRHEGAARELAADPAIAALYLGTGAVPAERLQQDAG